MFLSKNSDFIFELEKLVSQKISNVESKEIKNCQLYKAIQQENELVIDDTTLSKEAVVLIAQIAAVTPSLTSVTIRTDGYYKEMMPTIVAIIAKSPTIVALNLKGNNLGEYGPETVEALEGSFIKNLILSNNNLREYGPATAQKVSKTSIEGVDFSYNYLGKDGPATAEFLAKSSTLKRVGFAYNELGDEKLPTAEALAKSTSIAWVNFNENKLGETGPAIAEAFAKLPSLEYLGLAANNLIKSDSPVIAENINRSSTLEILDLSCCDLEEYSFETAKILLKSPSLKTAYIDGNGLDEIPQIKEIADLLKDQNHQVEDSIKLLEEGLEFFKLDNGDLAMKALGENGEDSSCTIEFGDVPQSSEIEALLLLVGGVELDNSDLAMKALGENGEDSS